MARKCIVDSIEEEIEKTDNEELREAFIEKLTDVLESDITFNKPKPTILSVVNVQSQKIPSEPVSVRGTPLKLKNMDNVTYRKFCTNIADMSGYASDFSDAPFNNIVKNARVYEAIKRLYLSGRIDQELLDNLVKEMEDVSL
jgi:hypothetical protein